MEFECSHGPHWLLWSSVATEWRSADGAGQASPSRATHDVRGKRGCLQKVSVTAFSSDALVNAEISLEEAWRLFTSLCTAFGIPIQADIVPIEQGSSEYPDDWDHDEGCTTPEQGWALVKRRRFRRSGGTAHHLTRKEGKEGGRQQEGCLCFFEGAFPEGKEACFNKFACLAGGCDDGNALSSFSFSCGPSVPGRSDVFQDLAVQRLERMLRVHRSIELSSSSSVRLRCLGVRSSSVYTPRLPPLGHLFSC